jgi:hypothetical protein
MASPHVKTNVEFGLSPTDALVMSWLEERGIAPGDVVAYRITRGGRDLPTIELTMIYSEEAVTGDGVPS